MITNKPLETSNNLLDHAATSADLAIKSTQRATTDALDALANSVKDLRNQVAPLLSRGSEQIGALTQRSVNAVRDGTQHARDTALRASDSTVGYIRDEPVKAMLIAAATGAALMALVGLLTRAHGKT
jgi:ElaB/YqjD/DUF883 family membrane-anchored ribosome-binding protein